jgi:hypothetical protein
VRRTTQHEVLAYGQGVHEAKLLMDKAQLAWLALRPNAEREFTGIGRVHAGKNFDQGRLSSAIRTE